MTDRFERIIAVVLLSLAAIVFFVQARSLYVTPEPNSIRWFGDETWLMQEAKSQITTGVVRYSLARGTPLTENKGAVLGMPWLSSLIYGLPVTLASSDPIDVGRSVTAVIGVMLAISLFTFLRMFGVRMSLAALAVVLLVADRSMLFTAHSARPDLLAGLIVLAVFATGLRFDELHKRFSAPGWIIIGALMAFLASSSSIHLLTLLPLVTLYFVWRLGAFSNIQNVTGLVAGIVGMVAVLFGVYAFTTGSTQLFPGGTSHEQFHDVVSSIPILRPLSRSVQFANIVIRSKELWSEAPQALAVFLIAVVAVAIKKKGTAQIAIPFAIVFVSWLLLQGAEVHYMMHVVPLMIFVAVLLWSRGFRVREEREALVAAVIAGLLTFFAVRDANTAYAEGLRIQRSNERAVAGVFTAIAGDWQRSGVPLVLTEPPSLEQLTKYPLRVTTDHFLSFPSYDLPLDRYLDTLGVDYIVLYNSPSYPKAQRAQDPFYQTIRSRAKLIDLETGTVGDFGRSYFDRSTFRDTLLVFRWPRQ